MTEADYIIHLKHLIKRDAMKYFKGVITAGNDSCYTIRTGKNKTVKISVEIK